MTLSSPKLSVVVPARNEAPRIQRTIDRVARYMRHTGRAFELVVVDDGSTDGTAQAVERTATEVLLIRHDRGRGKGAACRTGVAAASGDRILVMDADLSIPIEELDELETGANGAPIVIGSKYVPGKGSEYPALRRFGSRVGQWFVSTLVVPGFHDTQCGFKLFHAPLAKALFAISELDGFGFDFEILYLARRYGIPVREVPVRVEHHSGGTVRLSSYLATLAEVFRILVRRVTRAYPNALSDPSPRSAPGSSEERPPSE